MALSKVSKINASIVLQNPVCKLTVFVDVAEDLCEWKY